MWNFIPSQIFSYSIVKVPKFFPKVTDLNFDQNLNIFETATGESVFYSAFTQNRFRR